jgi:uncharacterized membrane protein YkoI
MTDTKGTQTMYTTPLAMTGTGILALALLTGCTTAEPEAENTPAQNGATTAATAPAQTSPATGDATDGEGTGTATPGDDQSATGTAPATGEDPVYAAIDAVYAGHPEVFIVQVDRDDDDTAYEIEAHEAGTIREFNVTADGTVREDDSKDADDDHSRRARDATVTVEDAARAALEGRAGQTIDEMELDDENDTLVWKVELDRENGDDGDELRVDASAGTVTEDR